MFQKVIVLITIFILVITTSACELTPVQGVTGAPTDVPLETQVALIVAQTQAAQTIVAIAVESTLAAAASNTPEFTFTPSFTATPEFTFTPTFTNTPSTPQVTVSVNTNCRSGPNTSYDQLGVMVVGEKAEAVGRSTLADTIIIRLPSNPAIVCWLWTQNASVTGDTAKLPVVPVPPTPTSKLSPTPQNTFTVVYVATQFCAGMYRIKFKITNTGATIWESDKVIVTDQSTSITKTAIQDNFPYYDAACAVTADLNLEKGEMGFTTSDGFAVDPTGHNMAATIQVCSSNGLAGTCQEKSITFKP